MRTYLASLLLALSLTGTALADSSISTSTTTTGVASPAPAPNAKKWAELTGSALPPIGPLVAAEQTGNALQQASLSPKTKQAAKQGLDDLKKQADIKLTASIEVLERGIAAKKRNENEQADVIRRMNEHETTRPGPNATDGEVTQFNAGVEQLNKALTDVHAKIAADNDKFTKDFASALDDFEKWVGERAGEYVAAGQKLLSGEIKEGEAMRQLRKAATGIEQTAEVMDGGGGGLVGSDAVDTRGVEKWTPEQRAEEQKKPRVQAPKRKTPPPPPPPSVEPPSTSSDTAKSKQAANAAKPKRSR
jgi:hypothetical protein